MSTHLWVKQTHLWDVFLGDLEVHRFLDPDETVERLRGGLLSLTELGGTVVERDLYHQWGSGG